MFLVLFEAKEKKARHEIREIMTIKRCKAEGKVHGLSRALRSREQLRFTHFASFLSFSFIYSIETGRSLPPPHSRSCYCRSYLIQLFLKVVQWFPKSTQIFHFLARSLDGAPVSSSE